MQYMQIFTKYYEKLYSAISEKCDLDNGLDLSFELYPFLVVTGTCSFMGLSSEVLRKESNIFSEEILNPALNITSGSEKEFADRMDLYVSVIQGNPLRGDWCMGFIPPHLSSDLVMRCVIALGDIILNPDCASNYFSDSNNKTTIQTMKVFSVFAEEIPNIMDEYRNELQEKALESSDKTRRIKRKSADILSWLDRIVQKTFSALSGMGPILLLLAFGIGLIIVIIKL